ncbi:MAG: glycosyltransferase family 2 protein [Candidatus Yanofskybacteria bacterium]|nr:glycosyltransferase family 2 protein [Candidatus Yanofskybacteria bacterium]
MLSIIIVNYKNPALLRLCLKSLERVLSPKLNYETLVVDISSEIETQNVVLEEFSKAKLLPFKDNIGYTKGVNEGIKASSGDFLLILNPDIVPLKNSIETLLSYMEKHKDVGLAGPQLLNFDGTPQRSCFGFYNAITIGYRRISFLPFKNRILKKFFLNNTDLTCIQPADWLMGSALMARRDAINRVGLMDERFFLYFSDVDWAKRFWENGYKVVYYPLAKIYHYHRRISKRNFWLIDIFANRQSRQHIKDGFRYLNKWGALKSSENRFINERV